jgi:outer membrane autotransporter protein
LGVQYTWLHQDEFTETGAGNANLTVDVTDTHSFRTRVGSRFTTNRCTQIGVLVPEFRAQWVHEYLDAFTGANAGPGGVPSFVSPSAGLGRDWAIVGGGLTLHRNACLALNVNYDLQINNRQQFHVGYGGVQFSY